jgi:hypothetical protein
MTRLTHHAGYVRVYMYLSRVDTCVVHINLKKIKIIKKLRMRRRI